MPSYLKKFTVRPTNNTEKIYVRVQKLLKSRFKMLQYLVKHSRPDIAHANWELPKIMDIAN